MCSAFTTIYHKYHYFFHTIHIFLELLLTIENTTSGWQGTHQTVLVCTINEQVFVVTTLL